MELLGACVAGLFDCLQLLCLISQQAIPSSWHKLSGGQAVRASWKEGLVHPPIYGFFQQDKLDKVVHGVVE